METLRIGIEKANNGFIVKTYEYFTGHNDIPKTYVFENIKDALNFIEEQLKKK
jgi:hypothetical protein